MNMKTATIYVSGMVFEEADGQLIEDVYSSYSEADKELFGTLEEFVRDYGPVILECRKKMPSWPVSVLAEEIERQAVGRQEARLRIATGNGGKLQPQKISELDRIREDRQTEREGK